MSPLHTLGRLIVAIFVLWHAFSVAVYATPRESTDRFSMSVRHTLIPVIRPYLLLTSQWQLWNLFAPNPLRRVTVYRIDVEDAAGWRERETVKPGTFSVFRHATQFKMLGNLFDDPGEQTRHLADRFLHLTCRDAQIAPGTPIRLQLLSTVIPKPLKPMPPQWWNQWEPVYAPREHFETVCPSRS